ncbi:S66 peptidase family protein [Yoonia sp. SDW83-1]|uniref:S66 peptidase family protein n=1 Tax=Yoonia sp. SDW83-1 TaxID=3366945 RepID=UPI00398C502B
MRPLKVGDTIGLVSPASAPQDQIIPFANDFFPSRGYRVRHFGHEETSFGRMSAPDASRSEALKAAFDAPEVAAIMCTRGGYGSGRLIDKLDFTQIGANPKPFVGYSDITNLLMEFHVRLGMTTFHGPMVSDLHSKGDAWSIARMFDVLTGRANGYRLRSEDFACLIPGHASGRLIGGNLSILCAMAGTTKLAPDEDIVLLIEDVGEFMFRLDRCLVQLSRIGLLDRAKAILVADMKLKDRGDDNSLGFSLEEVFSEHFGPLGIPVAYDLPAGHTERQMTLPIGAWATVDVSRDTLNLSFPYLWRDQDSEYAA